MAEYRPKTPFNVAMKLMVPEWYTANGVRKPRYQTPENIASDMIFNASVRTFGGTETEHNGVYGIENTAVVETWYRPDIRSDCRVALADTGEVYEILGDPENINMRNQYLKMKIRRVGGKP